MYVGKVFVLARAVNIENLCGYVAFCAFGGQLKTAKPLR
jgi:hypothetical protein